MPQKLQRRVLANIKHFLTPKEVFELINLEPWDYSVMHIPAYPVRDRAGMAFTFVSGGRVSAIFGGPQYSTIDGELVQIGYHPGVHVENILVRDNRILVEDMDVVKRTVKIIEKYGPQAAKRDPFIIPLEQGIFENRFWDQLVPFGWLIMKYLKKYAPEKGRLFGYGRYRAHQIVKEVTGKWPHWFRAQAESFYLNYLLKGDSVLAGRFFKVRPNQMRRYIRFDWKALMKDPESRMNFDWIEEETEKIKETNL